MRKIPSDFKRYGDLFHLQLREDNIAVYSRKNLETKNTTYEVVKISLRTDVLEQIEVYPSSSSWGNLGFTYFSWLKALEKFEILKNEAELLEVR